MGSLSQPRPNIFTVGNMRVMICLGQGGLRSLSASSFFLCVTDAYAQHQAVCNNMLTGYQKTFDVCLFCHIM